MIGSNCTLKLHDQLLTFTNLLNILKSRKSLPQNSMVQADKLMGYISNNTAALFKKDIRLFHQGFPAMYGHLELEDDDFDLGEVRLDYQYRVEDMDEKLKNSQDTWKSK